MRHDEKLQYSDKFFYKNAKMDIINLNNKRYLANDFTWTGNPSCNGCGHNDYSIKALHNRL